MLKRTSGFVALAACLAAVGCGSDGEGEPIPANIADQLETRLAEVERRFDVGGGACTDIEDDSRPAIEQLVGSVPQNVDADVRQALREGFDRLFALTAEQCEEEQTQTQTETETDPAPAPEPAPLEPETTPPETTETEPPPETTETQPPPEQTQPEQPQPEQPPDQGQGGDAPGGGQGGSGVGGQGGEGNPGQGGGQGGGLGGQGGGALVPEDQG
jgi:hypothetical protein